MLTLPSHFYIPDLTSITAPVFSLRINPSQTEANLQSEAWFARFAVYDEPRQRRFLEHRFDVYAGLSFPDADASHLTTCINFFLWAFSFDDLSDEAESNTLEHQGRVSAVLDIFKIPPESVTPRSTYAAMLQSIWVCLTSAASPSVCQRFAFGTQEWCRAQVWQCSNRDKQVVPPVAEFINARRRAIGVPMVEAMIQYALNIDLPDYVFQDSVVIALSEATNDIMTWPNDICSFNKEQAVGDYQNLIACIMVERKIGLQEAVDVVVQMLRDRVSDYIQLKEQLPSFGSAVDKELARYLLGLENYVQGTVVWYYSSRYFGDVDVSHPRDLVVHIKSTIEGTIANTQCV